MQCHRSKNKTAQCHRLEHITAQFDSCSCIRNLQADNVESRLCRPIPAHWVICRTFLLTG
jgi:hypothetical protein